MLQQQILKESDISRWIAPIVLDTIALEWFPVHPIQWRFGRGAMQDVWLDCLKWILSKETMEMAASILAMANGRCDVEATTESRVICCKLLGCFVDAPVSIFLSSVFQNNLDEFKIASNGSSIGNASFSRYRLSSSDVYGAPIAVFDANCGFYFARRLIGGVL